MSPMAKNLKINRRVIKSLVKITSILFDFLIFEPLGNHFFKCFFTPARKKYNLWLKINKMHKEKNTTKQTNKEKYISLKAVTQSHDLLGAQEIRH